MSTLLHGWRADAAAPRGLADCSLVVATFRRPAEVVAQLDCIRELPDVPGEIVIVDGSPNDDVERALAMWARDLPYDLAYVRSPAGLTRQRNVGIDASAGAFVFFLDDDCLPEPGYFRAIRQCFIDDTALAVGAVCGTLVNEMDRPLSRRWRARIALGLAPRGEPGQYYPTATSIPRSTARPFTGARRVDTLPGGASAFRRTVLERHRFSHFFEGYAQGEDLEMSLRVGKEYTLLWCGNAHVVHDHAPGGRPSSMAKGRMEITNRYFIWTRHSADARVADRVRFWGDVAYSIAYDLAGFLARPTSAAPLRHLAGCALGALGCLVSPPRYEEPSPRREYEFDLAPLAAAAPRVTVAPVSGTGALAEPVRR